MTDTNIEQQVTPQQEAPQEQPTPAVVQPEDSITFAQKLFIVLLARAHDRKDE
jgi:hypothetical protein